MKIDKTFLDSIKPKVKGQGDFFSWQLYRFLKNRTWYGEVWKSHEGGLHIGFMDTDGWFHGRLLRNLCRYFGGVQAYAFPPDGFRTSEWTNVTEQFFKDYFEKGICVIHGDYAHKFRNDHSHRRTCEYCGKVETRTIIPISKSVWK